MVTIDLFRNASDAKDLPEGHVIFREGDPGDVMYGVVDGEVDIVVDGHCLDTIGPGGIVGEMALIDRSPRSASAVTRTPCRVVLVDQKRFMFLVQNTPFFAVQVLKVMAERMRKMIAAGKA